MTPAFADAVIDAIDAAVKAAEDRLLTRCAHLQAEVDALKARLHEKGTGPLVYRGVWEPGLNYQPGENVTFDGSLWVALSPTQGHRPGDPAPNEKRWQLAVKRGQDAR